ncbi:MAG: SpoIIE family protein phosphatase [Bacteriovoracaceae bacterium]|nr:SpoIIE family protein phosphatase [Bacteriovoracaceae bacterium]
MDFFIEVDYRQLPKSGNYACGDFFISRRYESEKRIVSVLADGLGSGIKASVLATLSATMALKFISNDMDIVTTSKIIMETLPVCQVRKIGYSTFTIIDMDFEGNTRVIEYDNPSFILFNGNTISDIQKESVELKAHDGRPIKVFYSSFKMTKESRLLFYSDGVTQAGIGDDSYPLGWGDSGARQFVTYLINQHPDISAGEISQKLVGRARFIDGGENKDDVSAVAIYLRSPRVCSVFTGPPVNPERDADLAKRVEECRHKTIICGGTTSQIVSKRLGREVEVKLDSKSADLPPVSIMEGIDLVTEGSITLTRVASILEFIDYPKDVPRDAAEQMVKILLESDQINFTVGLSVNEAHQNPATTWDLELRKNIIKKIASLLDRRFLKEVSVTYL